MPKSPQSGIQNADSFYDYAKDYPRGLIPVGETETSRRRAPSAAPLVETLVVRKQSLMLPVQAFNDAKGRQILQGK